MSKKRLTPMMQIALTMAFTVVVADRAAAAPIQLNNLHIDVDPVELIATVTAGIRLEVADGSDVFLDELDVRLFQDGVRIEDLIAGPTMLQADSFFALPWPLPPTGLDGGTTLFQITGLVANATYTGSFQLLQYVRDPDSLEIDLSLPLTPLISQSFSFTTAVAPVPEPATMLLTATGIGITSLLERRRRRRRQSGG